jgi:hypothetical protein
LSSTAAIVSRTRSVVKYVLDIKYVVGIKIPNTKALRNIRLSLLKYYTPNYLTVDIYRLVFVAPVGTSSK